MKRLTNLITGQTLLIVVLGLLIAFPFGCSKKESETDEIIIGAILPLTGSGAKYGQSAKKGTDLAVEEINALGGIRDKTLRVIYEDSMLDPKQGVSAINKLVTVNKVPAIIGAMASSVTLAIAPIAEKNNVVLLSPASSAPEISKAGDYIFRNTYSDIYEGLRMGTYAYKELKLRRMAVLHINNDFGVGLRKTFGQSFVKLGGEVVATESYEQGATDFRTQLNKVKQSEPDAIYIVGYSEMGQLLRQAKEIGINIPFISCIMFEDPKILEIAKEAAEGVIYAYPAYAPVSGQQNVSRFVSKFEQKHNEKPDIYAASSYDALKILAYAIDRGGFSSEEIKKSLYSIKDFPGVTGSTTFDSNGDVTKPIGIKKVQNGIFTWAQTEF